MSTDNGTVNLSACGRCKSVYYCGVECQHKDWADHKPTCKAVVKQRKEQLELFSGMGNADFPEYVTTWKKQHNQRLIDIAVASIHIDVIKTFVVEILCGYSAKKGRGKYSLIQIQDIRALPIVDLCREHGVLGPQMIKNFEESKKCVKITATQVYYHIFMIFINEDVVENPPIYRVSYASARAGQRDIDLDKCVSVINEGVY